MGKSKRKNLKLRKSGMRRRRQILEPVGKLRPLDAPNCLVTSGRGIAVFERGGKLFSEVFPPSGKAVPLDPERHAVAMGLNFCTGLIAENAAAKPGEPKAIVIHVPPAPRAHEYRGQFSNAKHVVPALLGAMPKPTRIEIVGGYGKGKCNEIQVIERGLLKNNIKPIIHKEHIGGRDPKRWVELRLQEGKTTLFDYRSYVMSIKEHYTRAGMFQGLTGQALRQYVAEKIAIERQITAATRKAGDKPFFR